MKENVKIYGGFTSGQMNLTDRDSNPATNGTVLSGDIGTENEKADNSYHVILNNKNGLTAVAVLDGFTLTGGNADKDDPDLEDKISPLGGAIYNGDSSPTVINCLFLSNSARAGGALYNNSSSPTLINCSFISNSTTIGGGAMSNVGGSPTLINCSFLGNSTGGDGGAIFGSRGSVTLTNCSFSNNSSTGRGGAIDNGYGTLMLTNCVFFGNGGENTIVNTSNASYTATTTAAYTLFEASETSYTDNGNNLTTTVSPFASINSTELSPCSPAIDAGNNDANATATDLAGNTRKRRTIDMGAYEYQGTFPAPNTATLINDGPLTANKTTATLTASSGTSYAFGNGATQIGSTNQARVTAPGTYTVTITDASGCTADASTTVTRNASTAVSNLTANPSPVCAGQQVTFTATVANTSGTYNYTLTNGASTIKNGQASGPNFSQTVTAQGSGNQTFTLTVTDAQNGPGSDNTNLTVNAPPATSFSNNGPLTVAMPTVTLTAGGGTTYAFSAGATQIGGPSGNTATVTTPGQYTVTVTGANGCTAQNQTTVTQNQQTAVGNLAASPSPVCAGQSVTFTANVANTSGTYDYTLTNNNGTEKTGTASGSAFSQTITAAGSGSQNFTLTVTDANNGPGSASASLTVNAPPVVTLSASPGTSTPGDAITVTASGCPTTVAWQVSGGTGSASGNAYTVAATGQYTLTATCTDGNSCTAASDPLTVTVGSPPAAANCLALGDQCSGNQFETKAFTLAQATPGSRVLSLTYRANEGAATLRISVNGTLRTIALPGTGGAFATMTLPGDFALNAGANDITLASGGGYLCFRQLCAAGPPTTPCSPPPAPQLLASPMSLTAGQSSTLMASGCTGTVTWSNGLGSGTTKTVQPAATTTYTASCTTDGCTGPAGSVTVSVQGTPPPPPPATGNCLALGDDCSGNQFETKDYNLILASGGSKSLALTYRANEGDATLRLSVNGTLRTVALPGTGSAFATITLPGSYNLSAGSNTITLASGGGYLCFRQLCTDGAPGGCTPPPAPSLSASPASIMAGQSSTLTASNCNGVVNWSDGLGTGTSKSVSPTATSTFTATCTGGGCASAAGSVTVSVQGTPPPPPTVSACISLGDECVGNPSEAKSYTYTAGSGGSKTLTLTYQAIERSVTLRLSVNGTVRTVLLPRTPVAGRAYATIELGDFALNAGNNALVFGTQDGYFCLRELCVSEGGAAAARLGVAEGAPALVIPLTAYPNPTEGTFKASFYLTPGQRATLDVSDVLGRRVWMKAITGQGEHSEQVDLPQAASGMYFLRLRRENAAPGQAAEFSKVLVR